jgi:hypothetical protein
MPESTQYATSSSSSSGLDDGRCDDGEFALDSAAVAEEAAVERKEVRRVRPLLSELQVPEWQELAKDWRKWRKMLKSIMIRRYFVLQVQGVGSLAQRRRVDQPRT